MTIKPPPTVHPVATVMPTTHPRLRAGHHLYPVGDSPDRQWRLSAPGDVFTRIGGPPQALRRLRSGTLQAQDEDARSLVEAFAARGLLDDVRSGTRARPAPRIAVAGDGPVAEQVRLLLTSWAEVTTHPVDGGSIDHRLDALVTCTGWLTDAAFRRTERRCRDAGIAWHQAHLEGTSLFVGPFSVAGGAGYEDLRGRRVAASTTPDDLLLHWSYLERPDEILPDVPWPRLGVVAVAAGLLVDDLQVWWEDATSADSAIRYEYEVGSAPAGVVVERHPVLPLPISDVAR